MSDVDDSMSCASSSVEFIQPQNDALTEMTQQDQQRFEELINDTTTVAGNLERALAQENKTCTLLQCKIDVLKKQHAESENANKALRKHIYNKQMEMEKISSSIFQQTQELSRKFPSEGLVYYSNMVTIIASMVDYIQKLKTVLKNNIDESNQYDEQLRIRKEATIQRIKNVRELMFENANQKNELFRLTKSPQNYCYDAMEEKITVLNAKYNECRQLKNDLDRINRERDELMKMFDTVMLNRRQIEQIVANVSNRCEEVTNLINNEGGMIRKIGISIENDYRDMMAEVDTGISHIIESFRRNKNEFVYQKEQMESYRSQEMKLETEINDIRLQTEFIQVENEELLVQTNAIIEQDSLAVKIDEMSRQQVDSFSSAAMNVELENIVREIEQLRIELDSLSQERNEFNDIENTTNLINEETIRNENEKLEIANLEAEIAELERTTRKMMEDIEKAKYMLTVRQEESSIIKNLRDNIKYEIEQRQKENIEAINQKLTESDEKISKLNDFIIQNRLLIDALNDDIEKSIEDYVSIQRELWSATRNKDDNKTLTKKLTEEMENETVACENDKKLLEDLEKNSFPRNKIPADWFKSFVAEKQEYERLEKEKLELVKLRDKLTVEIESKGFSQKENPNTGSQTPQVEPKQKQFSESVKTALYDVFKERISKETIVE